MYKIYSNGCKKGPSKVMKTVCKTINKMYEIYWKHCKEGPSKDTKIAKITKFNKTAKLTVIWNTTDKMYKIIQGVAMKASPKLRKLQKLQNLWIPGTAIFTVIVRPSNKIQIIKLNENGV